MKERKTSILIVDDDLGTRETLTDILTVKGYNVTTAESGIEALAKLKRELFKVILMDNKMIGIDGIETIREIKKIVYPEVAIIMMTAYVDEALVAEALREGAYAVVYKPLDMEKTIKLIEGAMPK
ncbi:MAG: response regulator [Candidatus Hydrothermarchaeales archaeon]